MQQAEREQNFPPRQFMEQEPSVKYPVSLADG